MSNLLWADDTFHPTATLDDAVNSGRDGALGFLETILQTNAFVVVVSFIGFPSFLLKFVFLAFVVASLVPLS